MNAKVYLAGAGANAIEVHRFKVVDDRDEWIQFMDGVELRAKFSKKMVVGWANYEPSAKTDGILEELGIGRSG